jgi:hypothetical protein
MRIDEEDFTSCQFTFGHDNHGTVDMNCCKCYSRFFNDLTIVSLLWHIRFVETNDMIESSKFF